MDDSDKTIKIQRLKGASNYRIWSAEISAHLEGKGLMGVTLGEEPKPDELNTPHWNIKAVGTTEGSSSGVESGSIEDSSLDKWKRKDAKLYEEGRRKTDGTIKDLCALTGRPQT